MGTKERLEILRDKIKCPQFGDIGYGEWGALRLEQRKAIKDLIDSNKNKDKTINELLKRISNLEFEVERLDNIINDSRRILGEYKHYSTPDEIQNMFNEEIVDKAYIKLHSNLQELKGEDKE